MWDSLGARHARFEQATRTGAVAFQFARRERVFERDIFRFGTATTASPRHTLVAVRERTAPTLPIFVSQTLPRP
jgi:hypothetical protein